MVNNLYWGYIDILILLILIVVNVITYLKFRNRLLGCFVVLGIVLLYAIVLPFISQIVEVRRVVAINGADDNFTFLYTYLRFPTYGLFGFIQLLFIATFYKSEKIKKN